MFVAYPHSCLALQAPVADALSAEMQDVGTRLLESAKASKAYGLAAAHIGEAAAIIVVNVNPEQPIPEYLLMYNPHITTMSDEKEIGPEASVSLEGIQVDVERAQWVDVSFEDFKGQSRSLQFDGFVARCIQHEVDQVNGIFFLEKVSKLKRDMALKKYNKSRK